MVCSWNGDDIGDYNDDGAKTLHPTDLVQEVIATFIPMILIGNWFLVTTFYHCLFLRHDSDVTTPCSLRIPQVLNCNCQI